MRSNKGNHDLCAPENPEHETGHQIEGVSWWQSFKSYSNVNHCGSQGKASLDKGKENCKHSEPHRMRKAKNLPECCDVQLPGQLRPALAVSLWAKECSPERKRLWISLSCLFSTSFQAQSDDWQQPRESISYSKRSVRLTPVKTKLSAYRSSRRVVVVHTNWSDVRGVRVIWLWKDQNAFRFAHTSVSSSAAGQKFLPAGLIRKQYSRQETLPVN